MKQKLLLAVFAIVLISVLNWLPAPRTRRFLTAGVGLVSFNAGTEVRIIVPESRTPPAEFEPLALGEHTVNPALCAQNVIDRYFGGSTGQYLSHLQPQGTCAAKLTEATDLMERLSMLTAALAPFAILEESLKSTVHAISERKSIDGLTLVLVPVPQIQEVPYRTVSTVGMTCIQNQDGNTKAAAVPVGSVITDKSVVSQSVTPAQRAQMAEIKRTSQEGIADVMKVINKGKKVGLNDSLKLSDRLSALFDTAQNMFSILTLEEFQKNYSALPETDILRISFSATPLASCAFPWLEGKIARKKYGVPNDTPFIPVSVTVDSATLEHFCLPEGVFLASIRKGVEASQMQILKYAATFAVDASGKKLRLQNLKDGGYGCTEADTKNANNEPAPDLEDFAAESIFDTISVDLKVNGQDDSVTVAPGSRIIPSWISEGATRCKANWSRGDIAKSGTIAGRVSRSVTIKIACINADGERADDEVRVDVL